MSPDATQEEYEEVQAEIKKKEDEVSNHLLYHFPDGYYSQSNSCELFTTCEWDKRSEQDCYCNTEKR